MVPGLKPHIQELSLFNQNTVFIRADVEPKQFAGHKGIDHAVAEGDVCYLLIFGSDTSSCRPPMIRTANFAYRYLASCGYRSKDAFTRGGVLREDDFLNGDKIGSLIECQQPFGWAFTPNDALFGGELHLSAGEEIHDDDMSAGCGGYPATAVGSD